VFDTVEAATADFARAISATWKETWHLRREHGNTDLVFLRLFRQSAMGKSTVRLAGSYPAAAGDAAPEHQC